MGIDPLDESQLRAKYFDWCSARLAERFLELPPEQIYVLAQQTVTVPAEEGLVVGGGVPGLSEGGAAGASSESSGPEGSDFVPVASIAAHAGVSYQELVARVVEVLAQRLTLPDYQSWRAAYLEAPETYEHELLGLWRDAS